MIDTPLLASKMFVPSANPRHVIRPRLHGMLSGGLSTRLMVVSAPAGFGKTTLVSNWLHELVDDESVRACYCWLSLDEGDNDASRFMAYLSAAVQRLARCSGEDTDLPAIERLHFSGIEENVNLLINRLAAVGRPMILILDDYHLVNTAEVHQALNYLIDYQPPALHLVLVTRAEPPLRLARLRACAELVEIDQNDLRFTWEEAVSFFTQTRELSLTEEQVAELTRRTEGWIAGLQMAALALQSNINRDTLQKNGHIIQDFSGSSRYIFDYLMEEVLLRQPDTVQEFLLQTSILKRLNGQLCDALMGDEHNFDSAEMLQTMESRNVFILALDAQRSWYRYHHLFADLLRRRLKVAMPERLSLLHNRASVWYEKNGMMTEAIEHALAAASESVDSPQDYGYALDLIETEVETALAAGETGTVHRWLAALPDELIRTRPYLCVYHAFTLVLCGGSRDVIIARLDDARKARDDVALEKLILAFQSFILRLRGNDPKEFQDSGEILADIPVQKRFLRSLIITLQSLTDTFFFDLPFSPTRLEEASRFAREAGNWMAYAIIRVQIGDIYTFEGKLHAARAEYDHIIKTVNDGLNRKSPVAGLAFIGKGYILYEWNNLAEAEQSLKQGFELMRGWGEANAMDYHINMAYVYLAQGNAEEALRQMSLAGQLAIKFDLSEMDDRYIDALQARLSVVLDDVSAGAQWLQRTYHGRSVSELIQQLQNYRKMNVELLLFEIEMLVMARLLLKNKKYADSYLLTAAMLPLLEKQELFRFYLEALLLHGMACQTLDETSSFVPVFEEALLKASDEGYIRSILDEGSEIARLLLSITPYLKSKKARAYTGRLLKAFDRPHYYLFKPGKEQVLSDINPVSIELAHGQVLTARECEVLTYIAEGLSNQQIAERMVIALSTVKTHIHSVYQKLGVTNRTSAVARSRDLKLV